MPRTFDIFISYSPEDGEWVWETLLPRLEGRGLRVCIDKRDFRYGVPTLVNIEDAVERSRHTVIVLTPAWLECAWADFQSLLAGTSDPNGREQKLVPLKLHECQPPLRIRQLFFADFTDPEEHVERFEWLLNQLGGAAPPPPPPAAPPAPFVVGPPIQQPASFFGRTSQVRRIFGSLRGGAMQNTAIVGPRRSGKTSLLLYLSKITTAPPAALREGQKSDWLPEAEDYRWVFVDFQDPRLRTRKGLLTYLLQCLELPAIEPCDLEHFVETIERHLRHRTVILLDEIGVALHRCPEFDDEFWEGLRSLTTSPEVEGRLAFVLAAHESPIELAHATGHSSPFFNVFGYTATMGQLTEPEARELIGSSEQEFPDSDVEWILSESGRWPILLAILCREKLASLEEGDTGDSWRETARDQLVPFRHLLNGVAE